MTSFITIRRRGMGFLAQIAKQFTYSTATMRKYWRRIGSFAGRAMGFTAISAGSTKLKKEKSLLLKTQEAKRRESWRIKFLFLFSICLFMSLSLSLSVFVSEYLLILQRLLHGFIHWRSYEMHIKCITNAIKCSIQ